MDLQWSMILLLVLVGAGSAFVQRVSGFGLAIFAMLFFPHFMPHTAAAAVACLFSCGTSTYNTVKYRKDIPVKTALPLLLAAAAVIPFAVSLASKVPQKTFKLLLGVVLIVLSLYFLIFSKRIRIKSTIPNGLIAGALGGALSGLFSTGGPPAVLYLTNATEDKQRYFAAIQFYFCLTNLYATAVRAFQGILTWEIVLYALIGFAGCVVGDQIGRCVFEKIDGAMLKKVIYIGMIVSGISMIV